VITKLCDYGPFSRNCRIFTELLLLCIRLLETPAEVFEGLPDLPSRHAAMILKWRIADWKMNDRASGVPLYSPIRDSLPAGTVVSVITPHVIAVDLVLLLRDLIVHGPTNRSLLCAFIVGVLLSKASDARLFYKAKCKAVWNLVA
jgi:hypothetical protein